MQRKDEFKKLLPMLGAFHTAKCVEHCIGKFIQGSGLDDALKHTKVFTVKTVDSALNGTHYVRLLKAFLILASAIEKMKWKAFYKQNENVRFRVFDDFIQFQHALAEKGHQKSKKAFELCSSNIPLLKQEF